MAKVTLTIAGYSHELTCRDGEEAHFLRLGQILDEKAGQAARSVGGLTEVRMLLFAGLLLADEIGGLRSAVQAASDAAAAAPDNAAETLPDPLLAQAVAALAARIETLAESLEADIAEPDVAEPEAIAAEGLEAGPPTA
ncbi:cell division protein ZapA [Sphingomonas montana]|uniref:cell division protein ZapA n=1 Tax=Sphingomonas montana TaxID=1843236 RepID=UPI00096FE757|nr:cell division protein ZapA [Sphingomonas montana]